MSPVAEDPTPQDPKTPESPAAPESATKPPTDEPASVPDNPTAADAPSTSAGSSVLPPVPVQLPDTGYTAAGVPTLEGVREKIESRYGTALGATELAEETPEGRTSATAFDARQKAAADKLEEIRASMHKPD